MRLEKVKIQGFRSIKEMEINFTETRHMVLVGKNESGKSNILKALNLLSEKNQFQKTDVKELHKGLAEVIFIFSLSQEEIKDCADAFCKLFPAGINDHLTQDLTVQEFLEEHIKYILYIISPDTEGYWGYWELETAETTEQWYRAINEIPQELQFPTLLTADSFINQSYIEKFEVKKQEALKTYLKEVSIEDIYNDLRKSVAESIVPENQPFPVVSWKYSTSEHDLPSHVVMNEFAENPDTCLPLLAMFLLTGIEKVNIKNSLVEAKNLGHNRFTNFLNTINRKTNTYIKKHWKESEKVKIELRANGEDIVIGIKEVNRFDFTQRSDGFRRLVSFLLMISMVDEENNLDGQLILIDEPETGLHPSSAKDLRNKLIELGKNNMVVYATHSISMIDTENIENNFIVTKEKEETKIEVAKEDGTSPAENIYNAIGHSIYADLKKVNILLEGYTDKKTLDFFMKEKNWNKFGICYTDGVKNIKCITPILDLADRKYFILSDADEIAMQHKKKMKNSDCWYTYKELESDAITIEDFYKHNFFDGIVKEILNKNGINTEGLKLVETNRIEFTKDYLVKNKVNGEESKKIIKKIKTECIEKIKKSNIEEKKITFVLDALLGKINLPDSQ